VLRGNFAFDRISLANFDGSKVHEADEIRVGAHFLAVTGRWGNNQGRLLRQVTAAEGSGFRVLGVVSRAVLGPGNGNRESWAYQTTSL
jgi:hypothetical protein